MAKKMNGGRDSLTKTDEYIEKILSENANIYKYEASLIVRTFKKTIEYFIENLIEFKINDVLEFVKFTKKSSNIYVRYRDEYQHIPEHEDMKFKVSTTLKDYLNERNSFKNVRHREKLPEGLTRKNKFNIED